MKTSKWALRLIAALSISLVLSFGINAQNYRDRDHKYNHHYGYYNGVRPRISIGIGYNPYYNFRPVTRPRIYYHPPYRLPYRYGHYGPAFGVRISILPFGYNQFFIGGNPYYYYDGIYYRPYKSGGYQVTQPPLGAMVKHLPAGAKVTVIDGQKYYELGGTFYQERITANNKVRYEVVGTDGVLNTTNADAEDDENDATQAPSSAPVTGNKNKEAAANGLMVSKLPDGSNAIFVNEQKYFISPAGVYYQQVIDGNNTLSYKVAGTVAKGIQASGGASGTQ